MTNTTINRPDFIEQLAEGLADQFLGDHDALFISTPKSGALKFKLANVAKSDTLFYQGWTQAMAPSTVQQVLIASGIVAEDDGDFITSEDGEAEAEAVKEWMQSQQ